MSESKLFRPKAFSIRDPLDTKKNKGRIVNPPRLNQMGGLDKLREANGPFKNEMTLKKPSV